MTKTEIRVRPVIRHIVTRFSAESSGTGASEVLGEFDNERAATLVEEALVQQELRRTRSEYVIVQSTMGEIQAKVFYEYSEAAASQRLKALREDPATAEESYRVYSRVRETL